MVAKKPHVFIIGAGMAGLTAAHHLHQAEAASSFFHITLLEASDRIGGRILTSEFGGDRIELGATWIHGIDGSPVYDMAQRIGALQGGDMPWERQDGFPGVPTIKAEGGLTVHASIANPIKELYQKLMIEIRSKALPRGNPLHQTSIGSFVREGFSSYLQQQQHEEEMPLPRCEWTLRGLQEGVFSMQEYIERVTTSANSVYDLAMEAEHEYRDYPGEQITIARGYSSLLNELAASLPEGTIQFGKKAVKFSWNNSPQAPVRIHCEDGCVYEADHVILTVSLGVLKAGTTSGGYSKDWAAPEGRPVCRSVAELRGGEGVIRTKEGGTGGAGGMFEPALPEWKVEAIGKLGYGVVDKVFVRMETAGVLGGHIQLMHKPMGKEAGMGADDHNTTTTPWWMRKTFSVAPIYEGSSVVLCWFAGEEAAGMEAVGDEELMDGLARALASCGVVPGCHNTTTTTTITQVARRNSTSSCSDSSSEDEVEADDAAAWRRLIRGVARSRWAADPLFEGSYSFVATGASGEDIEELARPLPWAPPHPPLQLLFAGEATDRHHYSTTHGAHLSGLREASRLLSHYGLLTHPLSLSS